MHPYIIEMPEVDPYVFKDDGTFPNNEHLAVLHYKDCLDLPGAASDAAAAIVAIFLENDWKNSWTDGIYDFQHYHSITHEAMGVCQGMTRVQLGGDAGPAIEIKKGDVLIIPAGVAHKKLEGTDDFLCVGAYPEGHEFDINYGKPEERPQADNNIASLPLPLNDPLYGKTGMLYRYWTRE